VALRVDFARATVADVIDNTPLAQKRAFILAVTLEKLEGLAQPKQQTTSI
jgi:hypothetical protein